MFRLNRASAHARAAALHMARRTATPVAVRCLTQIPAKSGWATFNGPSLRALIGQSRTYSVLTQNAAKQYKYDDVKALTQASGSSSDALLIDVREPLEFQEGHIPGAHNVPFKLSPGAFDLSEEEFEESFGFPKPAKDQHLVFYCLGGVRLTAAEDLACSFGYTNRGNYVGSWDDWITHENAAKKE